MVELSTLDPQLFQRPMMSSVPATMQPEIAPPRLDGRQSALALWLAFLFSAILHVGVVGLMLFLGLGNRLLELQDVQQTRFRPVGLLVMPPPDRKEQARDNPQGADNDSNNRLDARFTNANRNTAKKREVPDKPPVAPSLPGGGTKTVGPGNPVPAIFGGGNDPFIVPIDIRNGAFAGPKSAGDGKASFFNIEVKGKRLVYVLDRSGSMIHNDAIGLAKRHLIRSLNGLSAKQQFQIIFYDETAYVLTIESYGRTQLIPATSRNLEKVKLKVAAIRPKGGTRHMLALRPALERKPDVIFFLTDADSSLNARELDEIRLLNKAKTRIYCVEFGKGPDFSGNKNFLKRLATQTRGGYRYVAVRK